MKSSLTRTRWAAIGAAVAVSLGGGAVMMASAATAPSNLFTAITPCRLLDTRNDITPVATSKVESLGIRRGVVRDKTTVGGTDNDIIVIFDKDARTGQVGETSRAFTRIYGDEYRAIMGKCDAQFNGGDLANVDPTALLLNVTAIGTSAQGNFTSSGFVTVYPWQTLTGSPLNRPYFSSLNPVGGLSTVSNNVTVLLKDITSTVYIPDVKCATGTHGENGSDCGGFEAFRVYNENGNVHLAIDVLGYYTGPVTIS